MTNGTTIIDDIEHASEPIIATIFVIAGFFVCLWGEKFFKQIIFFVGFIGGTVFTYFLINNIEATYNKDTGNDTSDDSGTNDGNEKTHFLISICVGLFIGFACVTVYKASIFVTGAVVGIILSQTIWQFTVSNNVENLYNRIENWSNNHIEIVNIIFVAIFAITFGFLAFKIIKIVLKLVTAFVGAFFCSCGVAYFLELFWKKEKKNLVSMMEFWETPSNYRHINDCCNTICYISVGLWLVLLITGIKHQYHLAKKAQASELRPEYMAASESGKVVVVVPPPGSFGAAYGNVYGDNGDIPMAMRTSSKGRVNSQGYGYAPLY